MRRPSLSAPVLFTAALAFSLVGCDRENVKCERDSDCMTGEICKSEVCAEKPDAGPPDAGVRDAGGGERCTPGTECRAKAEACDLAENCLPSGVCPADDLLAGGAQCRAAIGLCDAPEFCDGVAMECPADGFAAASTPCRASAGVCDAEETCSGAGPACPADVRRAQGVACRPALSTCDAPEVCDGTATGCPGDLSQPSSMQCAAQSCSAGVITPAAFCSGSAPTCSASTPIACNGYQCSGQTCRSSCASAADCLSTHYCQPGGQCAPKRADGQPCTSAATGNECQTGTCMGTSADSDLDGFGAGPVTFTCGNLLFGGRSTLNTDCCDSEPRASPGATAFSTTPRAGCGGFDFDCDGQSSLEFVQTNACQSTACGVACSGNPGWAGVNPACGTVATYVTNCATQLCLPGTSTRCAAIIESRTQSCR